MGLKRPTFKAELSDGTVHVVEVVHVDQLRAELEARKHGIPPSFDQAPVAITTLWVWASLARQEKVTVGYQEFTQQVLVQLQRAGELDTPEEQVGPTQQGQPAEQL